MLAKNWQNLIKQIEKEVTYPTIRLLDLVRDQHIRLPDEVRQKLLRATELHERCCEQERLQELVHQGLRYNASFIIVDFFARSKQPCFPLTKYYVHQPGARRLHKKITGNRRVWEQVNSISVRICVLASVPTP